jgi:hypothetical protein
VDTLEPIAVQATVVFRYLCSCCAKVTEVQSSATVNDEPKTDVSGNPIDGP